MLNEQEARALAAALEAAFDSETGVRVWVKDNGDSWGITAKANFQQHIYWYPSHTTHGQDADAGLFLRALAALGYNVSPRCCVTEADWALILQPNVEAEHFGPDLLPLLAAALIAHGLKLGGQQP